MGPVTPTEKIPRAFNDDAGAPDEGAGGAVVIVAIPGAIVMLFAVVIFARLLDLHELDAATPVLRRVDVPLAIGDDDDTVVAFVFEGALLSVENGVERWTFDGPMVPLRRWRPSEEWAVA